MSVRGDTRGPADRARTRPAGSDAPARTNQDWYRFYAPRRLASLTTRQILEGRARAEGDLDAVLARTGLSRGDRILEIGCGWGRHSLALARRGFGRVVSVDIAAEPVALARALARQGGLVCDIRQQDFDAVHDGPYAAVLSLYDRSVCGFPTGDDDARSLRHLAGLLEPGGWLVFGIDDWPADLPAASEHWRETDEGIERVEVIPDPVARTCTHRVTHDPARWPARDARAHPAALLPSRAAGAAGGQRIRPADCPPPSRRGTRLHGGRGRPVPLRPAGVRGGGAGRPAPHAVTRRPAPRG